MIVRNRAFKVAWLLLLVAWLVLACGAAGTSPTYVPTLTASSTPIVAQAFETPSSTSPVVAQASATLSPATLLPTLSATRATASVTPTATVAPTDTPAPALTGVLIIGVDGLRPEAIWSADTPNLDGLIARGSVAWGARTILPSATLPSHASMLSGSSPEVHGVVWNSYEPGRGYIPTPTVFSVAHDAGLSTAMFVGKRKLEHLAVPGTLDAFSYVTGGDARLVSAAADHLRLASPDLLFVHLPDVDSAGHQHGWLSAAQLEMVTRTDAAIGLLLEALSEEGRLLSTLVIVTADHGGIGRSHGGSDPESMTIPWIIAGPGIRGGLEIKDEVRVYDMAVTAVWALGLPLPAEWEGRPVEAAFAP